MLREYLKSLADKFRTYLGGEPNDLINAQDFPTAIDDVYEAGKQAGGCDSGSWYMLTNNGTRNNGTYQFAYWNMVDSDGKAIFEPQYDLKPTIASGMFGWVYNQIDLQAQFEKAGKTLDFSNCTVGQQCFYGSGFTRIGLCDWSKCPNLNSTYWGCKYLEKIDGIIFSETINYNFTNTFYNCGSLAEVTAFGSLATSGLNLSACPLTHDSIMSFINILEPTSTTKTITFGATNLAKLSDAEKAIATQKGWTLA